MADDGFSASELRARYSQGGSVPDDQLTGKQLRARYGIPQGAPGRAAGGDVDEGTVMMGVGVFVLILIVGFIAYRMST